MADLLDQHHPGRRLLLVAGVLAGAAVAGALVLPWAWEWWSYGRHVANIEIRARADPARCTDPKFPLAIEVVNHSGKTVEHTRVQLEARRPGYSSDLLLTNSYENDRVIPPAQGAGACWSVDLVSAEADASALEYRVKSFTVRFAE